MNDRTAFQNQSQENLSTFTHICFIGILALHRFLQIILEIPRQSGISPIDLNLDTVWQLPFPVYAGLWGCLLLCHGYSSKAGKEGICFVLLCAVASAAKHRPTSTMGISTTARVLGTECKQFLQQPKGAQIDPANQDQPPPIFWFSFKILLQVMIFGFSKSPQMQRLSTWEKILESWILYSFDKSKIIWKKM